MSTSSTRRPRRSGNSLGGGWSPMTSGSSRDQEEEEFWLDRELSILERALQENGEMRRRDLGNAVGCRYWGPRRFARALREGVERGRFRRPRRGVYAPAK
jgi:hypothetical protein